jgi:hypothetical protein
MIAVEIRGIARLRAALSHDDALDAGGIVYTCHATFRNVAVVGGKGQEVSAPPMCRDARQRLQRQSLTQAHSQRQLPKKAVPPTIERYGAVASYLHRS